MEIIDIIVIFVGLIIKIGVMSALLLCSLARIKDDEKHYWPRI